MKSVQADTIAYDLFSSTPVPGHIRLTLSLTDGDSCGAVVGLTDISGAPLRSIPFGLPRGISFRLELHRGSQVTSTADPSEAAVQLTKDRPEVQVEWDLIPVTPDILPPGDYTVPFHAILRAPSTNDPAAGAVTVRSIARAQVNFAGSSAGFEGGSDTATIDLGELVTGRRGHVILQLRSNTPAQLSFRSDNRGMLANAAVPAAKIRYAFEFDGEAIDLGGPVSRTVPTPQSLRGSAFDINVVVGDVTGALAGRYKDIVTIDVSP